MFKNTNYILVGVFLYFILNLTGIFPIEIFDNKFFNILGEIVLIITAGLVIVLPYKFFKKSKKEKQDE